MQYFRAHIISAALLAALLPGCGSDEEITGPGEPGMRLVSGAAGTDSIQTVRREQLVVEVRGADGRVVPGALVRFDVIQMPEAFPFLASALVSHPDGGSDGLFSVDTTDRRGRAAARVKFGVKAGTQRIVVTVPSLEYADTATYTIVAGAPSRVAAVPEDVVMYPGTTATLDPVVLDRHRNPRNDPVTTTRLSGGVTVQGNVVSAQIVGIAKVVAEAHGLKDTTTIAVVAPGVLAAASETRGLVTVNLDGSGFGVPAPIFPGSVKWSPSGSEIAVDAPYGRAASIVSMTGSVRPVRPSSAGAQIERSPVFSPDGAWVYVGVYSDFTSRLWRVRPDGSEAAPLAMSDADHDESASPSPDGARLAYVGRSDELRILDLATGAVTRTGVRGSSPAWSPLGDLIAYVDILSPWPIMVMRPDGTDRRRVTPTGNYPGVQWSPDGRWLIAYSEARRLIHVIDPATGVEVSLWFTYGMRSPSWKP